MAIARDNKAYNHGTTSSNTFTYSYTCTGSNLGLFVVISNGTSVGTITGVTYNGVSMTQIGFQDNSGGSGVNTYMFYLSAPATGANNVVVTASVATANIEVATISYTGVKQTGQPAAHNGQDFGHTSTSTGSQSVTPTDANSWVVWVLYYADNVFTFTNATVQELTTTFWGMGLLDSNGAVPASSYTMSWTSNEGNSWEQGIIAAISPAPPTQILKVSGVAQASISKVSGVTNANIKKVSGVLNQ